MNPDHSHFGSHDAGASPGGNVYGQLSLWTAAGLAGMVTGMLLARAPFFETMIKRLGKGRRSSVKPSPAHSLPMLAGAIIGSSKSTIEAVFGPPRSAVVQEFGVVVHPQQVYWQSDTWYYPLRKQGPMAIAINFDHDFATKVEFFTAPQV